MVEQAPPLSQLDWSIIGRRCKRLQVPLPNASDGLHTLAHRFYGLAEDLHRAARLAHSDRSALVEAGLLLKQANLTFLNLQHDWEAEWRESQHLVIDKLKDQAHTVNASGTEETVRPGKVLRVVE